MDQAGRWLEIVRRPEAELPLDEAALLISAVAHPGLDVPAQLARLDTLAGSVSGAGADAVCHFLFEDRGLRGDREHYDDPDNSFIDRVLDRGRGMPITLSVVLIEVARRCGVALDAVGMPGHFLVRDPSAGDTFIDPFYGGRRLARSDCARLLQTVAGPTARLTSEMLTPIGPRAILTRMLANLDASYERRQDHDALAWVSALRCAIPDAPVADRMQLAGRLATMGRFDTAAELIEQAMGASRSDSERERMLHQAQALLARLN